MIVVTGNRHSDVQRREQREYIGLDTSNQKFNQTDKQYYEWRAEAHPDASEYKGERNEAQEHDVPRGNGHEKTHRERNGLCKNTDDLHRKDDQTQRQRHTGCPEDVRPVSFVAIYIRNDKSQHGQREGHGYITCEVTCTRQEPKQVSEKDKEKQCQ